MEMDPHTLQQILQRIYQQMRCPQCGKKVPIDFDSIQVVAESAMLLQLKCEGCNAYVVLQASLNGIEQMSAPPYEENATANASSGLAMSKSDLQLIREGLEKSNGSFKEMFEAEESSGDEVEIDTQIV